MLRILIFSGLISTLTGCDFIESDAIKAVKNAAMPGTLNTSTIVGVFEGHNSCKKISWSSEELRGRTYVTASCEFDSSDLNKKIAEFIDFDVDRAQKDFKERKEAELSKLNNEEKRIENLIKTAKDKAVKTQKTSSKLSVPEYRDENGTTCSDYKKTINEFSEAIKKAQAKDKQHYREMKQTITEEYNRCLSKQRKYLAEISKKQQQIDEENNKKISDAVLKQNHKIENFQKQLTEIQNKIKVVNEKITDKILEQELLEIEVKRKKGIDKVVVNYDFIPSLDYKNIYSGPIYTRFTLKNGTQFTYEHKDRGILDHDEMLKRMRENSELWGNYEAYYYTNIGF